MQIALSIISCYIPWLVYTIILPYGYTRAAICCALSYNQLKQKFIIPLANLSGFICMVGLSFYIAQLHEHPWLISSAMMFLAALLSIVAKRPFSLSYARMTVEKKKWHHPVFLKINYYISLIWTSYFGLVLWLNIINLFTGMSFSTYLSILLIGVTIVTNLFPKYYSRYYKTKIQTIGTHKL